VEGLVAEKDGVQAQELIDPRRIPHHQDLDMVFTGLRDDPFIITVQDGRNVAAIVLELPLAKVLATLPQSTLLIWATSKIPDIVGPFMDLAGRALRSQFPVNDLINTLHPSEHTSKLGIPPDVIIFDTSRPAGFPNGRELTDDVADIVLDAEIPGPENDVPFLDEFPYLAPPHLPDRRG
jgi:hypothetical protein